MLLGTNGVGNRVWCLSWCLLFLLGACGGSATNTLPNLTDQGAPQTDEGSISLCPDDHCEIDGLCHPNASPNPNNACQQCLVIVSSTEWTNNDAGICDDGKTCTVEDACDSGVCAGVARDCDDNDVCTEDSCEDGGGCTFVSKASDCEDDNLCTDNSCDPVSGCVVDFNTDACDDGSACTESDQCLDGQCAGSQVAIDDNNPCTDDSCDPETGLVNTPNTLVCDDGDECTVGDLCADGACLSGVDDLDCDDGEYCTDDGCNASSGCYNNANMLPCSDGLTCTVSDICATGSCQGDPRSCDDGNDCTADSCSEPDGCTFELIISDACRPSIWGVFPNRGATVEKSSGTSVSITGHVDSGAGDITSLKINGTSVSVAANGAFTYVHDADYGNNIIVFEATDEFGSTRRRVQSFLLSNDYLKPTNAILKNGAVDPGIGIFIGQEVIDDGWHGTNPVDDIATIFEMILNDFDLNEVVPPDQAVGSAASYDIYVTNFDDLYRTVSLSTDYGVIEMEANIYFPSSKAADIKAKSWLPDINGELYLDRIEITADITTNVVNHQLVTEIINVNVEVHGLDVDIGWLVNWIVNFFEGYIANKVEEEFESQLASQLEPMLSSALGALAFDTTLNLQSIAGGLSVDPIDIFADPSSMIETPSGVELKMRVGAYGGIASYTNKGAPKRNGCGWGGSSLTVPKTSPLAMVVSDDAINVLLYSAWRSGLLEFEAPTDMLGASALIDQGISDLEVTISGMLAPTLSDCGPGLEPEVQIGDLRADVDFELFGQAATMTVYASMAAEVEVVVDEVESSPTSCVNDCGYSAGKPCQCDSFCATAGDCCADYTSVCVDGLVAQHTVSLAIGDVNSVEMEVISGSDALIPFEQVVMDALNEELVPSVLGAFTNSTIGGFPLPSLDIGGLAPGVPEGTLITLDPQTVQHSNGKITITGDVQ